MEDGRGWGNQGTSVEDPWACTIEWVLPVGAGRPRSTRKKVGQLQLNNNNKNFNKQKEKLIILDFGNKNPDPNKK